MKTVSQIITESPKSALAANLAEHVKSGAIGADYECVIGAGIISENPQSALGKAKKSFSRIAVVIGGRAEKNKSAGHHFAVVNMNRMSHYGNAPQHRFNEWEKDACPKEIWSL